MVAIVNNSPFSTQENGQIAISDHLRLSSAEHCE